MRPRSRVAWRLLQVVPVILLATFIVFGLVELIPGDPAVTLAGENPTAERIDQIRAIYGLDQPFLLRYVRWLAGALHGDLSISLLSRQSVVGTILQKLPYSLTDRRGLNSAFARPRHPARHLRRRQPGRPDRRARVCARLDRRRRAELLVIDDPGLGLRAGPALVPSDRGGPPAGQPGRRDPLRYAPSGCARQHRRRRGGAAGEERAG